jgi:hypothetical protein
MKHCDKSKYVESIHFMGILVSNGVSRLNVENMSSNICARLFCEIGSSIPMYRIVYM